MQLWTHFSHLSGHRSRHSLLPLGVPLFFCEIQTALFFVEGKKTTWCFIYGANLVLGKVFNVDSVTIAANNVCIPSLKLTAKALEHKHKHIKPQKERIVSLCHHFLIKLS